MTICAIHDRALSLGYEARRFPKVAPQAYAWLRLALDHAERNDWPELAERLRVITQRVLDVLADTVQEDAHVPASR